jgi:hypothetical protein
MITLALAFAAAAFGYLQTRGFVRRRLAYVEAAHGPAAPVIAGVVAALIAMPIAGILPFVGGGTALLFGASVGVGVRAGSRDIRHRRLTA